MSDKPMDAATAIATISKATQLVSRVNTIEEAVDLKNKAAAIQQILKKCQAAHIHLHEAAILKIRSERRLGELLPEVIQHGGNRKSSSNDTNLTLADLGLNGDESSRCQRIASIPEPELEAYFETSRAEGLELTTAGIMRLWKALNREEVEQTDQPFLPSQEQEAIFSWLSRRRESWPEQFRPTFTSFVKRILDHLEEPRENDGGEGPDTADSEAGAA